MIFFIAASFLAVSTVPSMAGMHGSKDGWRGKDMQGSKHHRSALGIWRDPQLVKDLELSEDQVNRLRDAYFAAREKCLGLESQFKAEQLHMDKAFSGKDVDSAAVRQLAEKIADIKGQLLIQKSGITADRRHNIERGSDRKITVLQKKRWKKSGLSGKEIVFRT